MPEDTQKAAMRTATIFSLAFGLVLAAVFFAITSLTGNYNAITRYGGSVWVLILAIVIALPTVAPAIKKRMRGRE